MKLSTAIEHYCQTLRAQGRSRSTWAGYSTDLRPLIPLAGHDSIRAFTWDLIRLYFANMQSRGMTPATLSRKYTALRGFGEFGLEQDPPWWTANPLRKWPAPTVPPREPRPFSPDELERLMKLDMTRTERLIRALLYYTGMRVTPLCQIRLSDIDFSGGEMKGVRFEGSIRTVQKGGRVIRYLLDPALKGLLLEWVETHPDMKRHDLILTQPSGRPFHRVSIERLVKEWGKVTGVVGATPHRFRHSYATNLLRGGVDVRVVQVMMGHASINTTMAYTKVSDDQVAKALGVLKRYE